jgi:murein endopeptidase
VLVVAEWDRATRSVMDGIAIVDRVLARGALVKVLDKPHHDQQAGRRLACPPNKRRLRTHDLMPLGDGCGSMLASRPIALWGRRTLRSSEERSGGMSCPSLSTGPPEPLQAHE